MYNIEIDIYLDHKRLRAWRCDTHLTTDEVSKAIAFLLSKKQPKNIHDSQIELSKEPIYIHLRNVRDYLMNLTERTVERLEEKYLRVDMNSKTKTFRIEEEDKKLETSPPKGLSVSYGGPGNYYNYL